MAKKYLTPDRLKLLLRIALGIIFLVGGYKIAFHADPPALAASYTDPAKGWISPFFTDWITNTLGMQVQDFLKYQGLIEMLLGILVILGLVTPVAAVLMGLLYLSFAIANPIAGFVRLSRDIALMFISFALAYYGAGAISIDAKWKKFKKQGSDEITSALIRYGLAFTLLASWLFTGGPVSNHLNNTIPLIIVLILALMFLLNIKVKWASAAMALWMLGLIVMSFFQKDTIFAAIDSVKREIGFFAASIVLYNLKRDSFLSGFKKLR